MTSEERLKILEEVSLVAYDYYTYSESFVLRDKLKLLLQQLEFDLDDD